jgi:MFS family permease
VLSVTAAGESAARTWRPDFRRLWTAQTVSAFGSEITGVALPLTAVALLNATPLHMGLLVAAGNLPNLLFAFHFGVLADRMARRWRLLVWSDLVRMALLALVPVAWVGGFLSIWLLVAVSLASGAASVCFRVAWSSFLPSVVPASNLVEANGKMQGTMTVAGLSGVGLAGILVQIFGAPLALAIDAVTYGVSALFLAQMRRRTPREAAPERVRRTVWAEVAEGLRYVWTEPRLRAIAGAATNLNLFSHVLLALFVLYLSRDLGFPPSAIGLLMASWGVGAVAGALLAHPLGRRFSVGRTILGASMAFSVLLFVYPAAPYGARWLTIAVLGVTSAALGFAVYAFDVHSAALRQAITPEELRGRAAATMTFLTQGMNPVGALLGGVLGQIIGVRGALWVAATGALTTVLWIYLSPLRHETSVRQRKEAAHQDAVLRDSGAQ